VTDPETLVPRMAGTFDEKHLRALPLGAADRFVLSLIDGKTSARSLADTVGLPPEEVLASLLKLESLKVVVLPSSRSPGATFRSAGAKSARSSPQPPAPPPPAPAAPSTPDDSDIELEPDHRRLIDETSERLESLNHYALLGVPPTADRKAIKRAYFEHTSRFHPDRYFRRRLGSYKLKMEAIFGRMTEAHDTLTSKERRAEYDAYLGSLARTNSIEQLLSEAMSEMKQAEAAAREVTSSSIPPPLTPRGAEGAAKPFSPPMMPTVGPIIMETLDGIGPASPPPASGRQSVLPIRSTPPAPQSRREMLARRLTGSMRPPSSAKIAAAAAAAYAKPEDAVDSLKRRYEEKVTAKRSAQARKYTTAGIEARAKGDMVAAANSLRVAIEFDPENAELIAAQKEAQRAADEILVEQYLKQAQYEERSERWADAARSWTRVARTRTSDANAHERAAYCGVKGNGNLHEAAAMGQRAVQLEPKNATFRCTLANVYLSAGLSLNAKRELEAALALAPDDATTAALLKRITKSS
jgi:curved DNA-binding protein CbpA